MAEYVCKICLTSFEKELTLKEKADNFQVKFCSPDCSKASRYVNVQKIGKILRSPQSSKEEIECGNQIKSFYPQLIPQYRIKGYDHCFDFYSPELDLLIEYDGTYWHNKPQQKIKDRKHLQEVRKRKMKLCVISDKEWKMFINSGMPDKNKLLRLLNFNIKK